MGPAGEKVCTCTTNGTDAASVGATVTTESPTMTRVSGRAITVKARSDEASDPAKAWTCP
jgi:hypothetical protein